VPTAGEIVANRPLAGSDLAKIILADVAQVLEQNGMLSGHIAYGRVSYEIRVTLHLDNPSMPSDTSAVRSVPRAHNVVAGDPALAAIEGPPPLAGADASSFVSAIERHRDIDSPNAARLAHGLPLPILRREPNGQIVEELVKYPSTAVPDDYPEATDADLTRMTREAFNLPLAKESPDDTMELAPAPQPGPAAPSHPGPRKPSRKSARPAGAGEASPGPAVPGASGPPAHED